MIGISEGISKRDAIERLALLPATLRTDLENTGAEALQKSWRKGAWTARQLVHHIADMHANWYVRMRKILTEDQPELVPVLEDSWAKISDARSGSLETSLNLIEGLHGRIVEMLSGLTDDEWKRVGFHPEAKKNLSIKTIATTLAWHGEHHLEQLRTATGPEGVSP